MERFLAASDEHPPPELAKDLRRIIEFPGLHPVESLIDQEHRSSIQPTEVRQDDFHLEQFSVNPPLQVLDTFVKIAPPSEFHSEVGCIGCDETSSVSMQQII